MSRVTPPLLRRVWLIVLLTSPTTGLNGASAPVNVGGVGLVKLTLPTTLYLIFDR